MHARRRYHNPADAPLYTRLTGAAQIGMLKRKPVKPAAAQETAEEIDEFDAAVPPTTEPESAGLGPAHFTIAARALQFILGGAATFTLRSKATWTRYTYKVTLAKPNPAYPNSVPVYFVSLLSGPDNTDDYTYLGVVKNKAFTLTAKSRMNPESAPVKAIAYTVRHLVANDLPAQLEIWHAGRCGRCNRVLTVPESVASGFGPECAQHIGGV